MGSLVELFAQPPALLVSLPRNDAALAQAAAGGGADGIKAHINVSHRASGTRFGSLEEERDALAAILDVGLPTGLVVGERGTVEREQVRAAAAMGFAFFDVYLRYAPGWYAQACHPAAPVAALSADEPFERVTALEALGFAAVEASLTAPEDYGTPLHHDRLADYARVSGLTSLPVIVPSQHALTPDDVPALVAAGTAGVLIGAVVTGSDPKQLAEVTRSFRDAIDAHRGRPTASSQHTEEASTVSKEEDR